MIRAVAILSLCAAFLVVDVQAACSLTDVAACENTVMENEPPSGACCTQVAAVDVPCFCKMVSTGNYDPKYVNNAVSVPERCGGAAYAHFKGQTCAGKQAT
jgi:hypothetical protein